MSYPQHIEFPYIKQPEFTEADIKRLLYAYKNSVTEHARMRYALIAFPELETQVNVPSLVLRAESRMQAAETTLMSVIKKMVR